MGAQAIAPAPALADSVQRRCSECEEEQPIQTQRLAQGNPLSVQARLEAGEKDEKPVQAKANQTDIPKSEPSSLEQNTSGTLVSLLQLGAVMIISVEVVVVAGAAAYVGSQAIILTVRYINAQGQENTREVPYNSNLQTPEQAIRKSFQGTAVQFSAGAAASSSGIRRFVSGSSSLTIGGSSPPPAIANPAASFPPQPDPISPVVPSPSPTQNPSDGYSERIELEILKARLRGEIAAIQAQEHRNQTDHILKEAARPKYLALLKALGGIPDLEAQKSVFADAINQFNSKVKGNKLSLEGNRFTLDYVQIGESNREVIGKNLLIWVECLAAALEAFAQKTQLSAPPQQLGGFGLSDGSKPLNDTGHAQPNPPQQLGGFGLSDGSKPFDNTGHTHRPTPPQQLGGAGEKPVVSDVFLSELQDKLVGQGINADRARQMLDLAKGRPDVMEALEALIKGRGQGQLINPDALSEIVEAGTQGRGQIGKIRELQVAAERVRQGHRVGLGTGADVVDFSAKEAIQLKNVTAVASGTVWDNLAKAAEQLSGGNGEVVPIDALGKAFQRTAEIIIDNPQNPLYGQTARQLLKALQQQFSSNPLLQENIGVCQIDCVKGKS